MYLPVYRIGGGYNLQNTRLERCGGLGGLEAAAEAPSLISICINQWGEASLFAPKLSFELYRCCLEFLACILSGGGIRVVGGGRGGAGEKFCPSFQVMCPERMASLVLTTVF